MFPLYCDCVYFLLYHYVRCLCFIMLRILSPVVITYGVSALLCLRVLLPFVIAYAFWVECCYMVCECDLVFRVVAKRSAEGVVSGLRSGDDEVGKGGMGITGGCTSLSGDSSPRNILSTYLAYLHTSLSGVTRRVPGSGITCAGDHRVIQLCGEVIRNHLR